MFKVLLVFTLISFLGFKSWSGPSKPKKTKAGRTRTLTRTGKKPLIAKKMDTSLISDLAIKAELKSNATEVMKEIVIHLQKAGPKFLIQKEAIFKESKQILQALKGKKSDHESVELLVSLVTKQSLSMMSTKSKKQIENFQFLLSSINSKLIASNVILKEVLKESSENYVVSRKKVSESKKDLEGKKFLEDLRKRCK